jgi:hypothetical protein
MATTAALAVFLLGAAMAADSAGENNWEKFKEGAKQAGSAAWSGTKNVAHKTGDAVATGARKTGEFVSEKYDDAKEYVEEKREERAAEQAGEPVLLESAPVQTVPPEQ